MTLTFSTAEEALTAADGHRNRIGSALSDSDARILSDVLLDGLKVTLIITQPPHPFENQMWEPLQIKRLFTAEEWANAKSAAPDTFEDMTLIFEPIDSETVATHLRALVGSVLSGERFTEITGRAV